MYAPVSSFTFAPSISGTARTVDFTNTSTGSTANMLWDFGDGSTSTLQNPSHSYATGGEFTVSLTATNSEGTSNSSITGFVSAPNNYALTTPAGASGSITGFSSPTTLTHVTTITFASAAVLSDYFFFGGRIQLSPSHTTGTLADNTLSTMFSTVGTIIVEDINHYQVGGSGGTIVNPTVGGSEIGTTPVTLYTATDGSPYSATTYSVSMVANAAAGSATVLTLTTTLGVVTSNGSVDVYTGTYSSNIQQRNNVLLSVPTFSHTGP